MRQITIDNQTAGRRLNKVILSVLPKAGEGFIQKMLRKKNITVNGKKVPASYRVEEGDVICLYFSEETLEKLGEDRDALSEKIRRYRHAYDSLCGDHGAKIAIVYEDDDMLLIDKPPGVLSQRSGAPSESVNEWVIGYLLATGSVDEASLSERKPGIANRLDYGTSGLMLAAKHPAAARDLSRLLSDGSLEKHYLAIVCGTASERGEAEGLTYERLAVSADQAYSMLDVRLLEGKKHRIRISLADIGLSVLGDRKYGDAVHNEAFAKDGVRTQLLHAHRLIFPEPGRTFTADPPEVFARIRGMLFS